MNYNNFKNSYLKNIYHIENDVFCVFDVKNYRPSDVTEITRKANQVIGQGFLFQTSGTTSDKKFVVHSFESIKTSCLAVNSWVDVGQKDKFLAPISIHHMGGFSVLARNYFFNGEAAIVLPNWDLKLFMKVIQDHKISVTSLVPSQIYEIVQNNLTAPTSLKAIFVGGSSIDQVIFQKAKDLGWPLLKTFGSSEACSQVFTQKSDSKNEGLDLLPHWEFKLDQENRLSIKGKSLFSGYLFLNYDSLNTSSATNNLISRKTENIPAAIFEPIKLDKDGFFQTDDHVVCENKILIKFLGRSNDFIKVNSFLVNIYNLRQRFYGFLQTKNFDPSNLVLIETEDLKSGFKFVVITDNLSFELSELVREWNKSSKSYEGVLGIYGIEKMPTTDIGKIKYGELKKIITTD